MSNDDILLKILYKWNGWGADEPKVGIRRDLLKRLEGYIEGQKIIALHGIRRSGKSTLFRQLIDSLSKTRNVDPKRTLYVNFEDPFFAENHTLKALDEVFKVYRERVNPDQFPFLFLDEIQNIEQWERWVRTKSELGEAKIFVTGSSAKLLSSELATVLTGRHISFVVYPLFFGEFLRFRGLEIKDQHERIYNRSKLRHLLFEYLHFGGMPEVVLTREEEKKETLLKQYFEDILFRDVVGRHQVRDVTTLRRLALHSLTNMSNLMSYNKMKTTYGIPMDVVRSYTSYLVECYLIQEQARFSWKVREQQVAPKKIYATDSGIRNAVAFRFSEDIGRLAENAAFNALRTSGDELYYAKGKNEVDFVRKRGTKIIEAIQVSFSNFDDEESLRRECQSLREVADAYGLKEGILVTDDRRGEIHQDSLKIHLVPLLDFLLETR